ncbi:universal stress protein [Pontiella sp.]|uniref:universal stress protein n=1 Tax=Pontiella sp. TaxID=2837462 RepID=UPI003568C4B2
MKHLLAAVDFSNSTRAVLEQSRLLAGKLNARLWIIHVSTDETATLATTSSFSDYSPEITSMPGDVQLARDISAEELKREHNELIALSADLRKKGIEAKALLIRGNPATEILAKAADLKADMIILGSHGHGLFHKALLGSVSESVIQHAQCNVLIVPRPGKNTTPPVL